MREKADTYFKLHCLFLLYSFGGACSKFAGQAGIFSAKFLFFYGMLLLILFFYALFWQQMLKKLPLVTAYANKAVTVIWGIVLGALLFGESISVKQIFSAGLIMIGIFLMGKTDG